MKFRKKPIVITAYQWKPGMLSGHVRRTETGFPIIDTLEGPMLVSEGDWIITGVNGEVYPCKPDIFEITYEKADE